MFLKEKPIETIHIGDGNLEEVLEVLHHRYMAQKGIHATIVYLPHSFAVIREPRRRAPSSITGTG